jgi:hypothetical protein
MKSCREVSVQRFTSWLDVLRFAWAAHAKGWRPKRECLHARLPSLAAIATPVIPPTVSRVQIRQRPGRLKPRRGVASRMVAEDGIEPPTRGFSKPPDVQ